MADTPLVQRLYLKPGYRVAIINAPEDYSSLLGELPEGAQVYSQMEGQFDLVQVFMNSKADIDQYAIQAIAAVKPGGTLWFSYPKKSAKVKTDINRDAGWDTVRQAGWEGVRQISIDAVWSALQFKPTGEIKRRGSMG